MIYNVKVGDKVRINGTKSIFHGLVEVKASDITIISSNQTLPAAVTINTLAEAVDNIIGKVTLTGVVSDIANNESGLGNSTFKVTIGNQVFSVRASSDIIKISGLANGSNVTITAFVGYYHAGNYGPAQGTNEANILIMVYTPEDVVINLIMYSLY